MTAPFKEIEMKLRIRNVAKIEEADLELNGITIIAGNNNTGKSTIGKIVFSLFNSLVNLEEKIVKQKRDLIYQVLKRKMEDISCLLYTSPSPRDTR